MHFSSTQLLLPLLPVALAQYGGGTDSDTTTSAATAPPPASSASSAPHSVQTVTVGADNALAYSPNTITADPGSIVEFLFFPPAHSVAQSTFASPCAPFTNGTSFFSGLFTTSSGTNANVFTLTINNTEPIWFYCIVPGHCEAGMAGVINPPTGTATLAAYQVAAAKVSSPPSPSVVQGGSVGPASAVSSAPAASTAPSSSTASSASAASSTSTASSTSSSASPSPTKSIAIRGAETGGGTQWLIMALAGLVAVGVGSLMV